MFARVEEIPSWLFMILRKQNVTDGHTHDGQHENRIPSTNTVCVGTVKPVLSGHSKTDKTLFLMTNGSLMKVESIAEC